MKHFVILQWTDDKLINFIDTNTDENYSDSLSKLTARTKFYEHTDIFIGQRRPAYTESITRPYSHDPNGIVHYLSLTTYRTNPIISLLQAYFLDGFDSTTTA